MCNTRDYEFLLLHLNFLNLHIKNYAYAINSLSLIILICILYILRTFLTVVYMQKYNYKI